MKRHVQRAKVQLIESLLYFVIFQKFLGRRWYRRWEKSYTPAELELNFLPKIMPLDAIVLDIGANRGEISYFLAKKCFCKIIYALEPQRRVFGVLNGIAQSIPQIIPINVALSSSTGERELYIPLRNGIRYTPQASFEKEQSRGSLGKKKELVSVDTLDVWTKKYGIKKVDFIKCDTEGHELDIFMGARRCLENMRPIILVEIYSLRGNEYREKAFAFFKKHGYYAYTVNGETKKLAQATATNQYLSANYFFFPAERSKALLQKANS